MDDRSLKWLADIYASNKEIQEFLSKKQSLIFRTLLQKKIGQKTCKGGFGYYWRSDSTLKSKILNY